MIHVHPPSWKQHEQVNMAQKDEFYAKFLNNNFHNTKSLHLTSRWVQSPPTPKKKTFEIHNRLISNTIRILRCKSQVSKFPSNFVIKFLTWARFFCHFFVEIFSMLNWIRNGIINSQLIYVNLLPSEIIFCDRINSNDHQPKHMMK